MIAEVQMQLVKPIVLELLRSQARDRRLAAGQQREAYIRGHYTIHDRLARELEQEADAIEQAIRVLEALSLQ